VTTSRDHSTRYDVVVVGAGHAGCEAALAVARMGGRVAVCTLSRATVATMPCNPAIGGLAKSHLVREIDALGGAMGRVIDRTGIQYRLLGRGKGPAVRAPRAQADKARYAAAMRSVLETTPGVDLLEAEVRGIRFAGSRVVGVDLDSGSLHTRAVVVTTGTFLYGVLHLGEETVEGGRRGERRTEALADAIRGLGLELARFKTGTPPRLKRDTIRYHALGEQPGETPAPRFSHFTEPIDRPQIACHLTRTTEETHDLLRTNLHRSPLCSGRIQGIGPRYCPSIEDKITRFPDRTSHQVFLEPEGIDVDTVYVNGLSTSMPADVQAAMIRSVPGLEAAEILRPGYAVEYDCLVPRQLSPSLMIDAHPGLFFAGQINGTSGYEEAAAQGLVGGVNALRYVRDEAPFLPGRADGYVGVLLDDLVTRDVREPYRMFTSQAEYRLLLRCDNAGDRFGEVARELGLLTDAEADHLLARAEATRSTAERLERSHGGRLRRPEVGLADLAERGLDLEAEAAEIRASWPDVDVDEVLERAEVEIKYAGYVARMRREIARAEGTEARVIPDGLVDDPLPGLSTEAREKLRRIRPRTFGQAGRIAGVRASDLSVLLVHAERRRRASSAAAARG